MSTESKISDSPPPRPAGSGSLPHLLLRPIPLAFVQPILDRIVSHVAAHRAELFSRLGAQAHMRFLIDPEDLPFVLLLAPDPAQPTLRAYRRYDVPRHDACIGGRFITLLDMIDGSLDGDALFFSRDLRVRGDTEAIVTLRNALDDLDGSVVDTVLRSFGPLSAIAALALGAIRDRSRRR
jgi:predicted lipid carrier protein YhbT